MAGGVCYKKGKEQGSWFEIKCVKDTILLKEANGEDASYERSLLKSWSKYPGWKNAGVVLGTLSKSKSRGSKPESRQLILGEGFAP